MVFRTNTHKLPLWLECLDFGIPLPGKNLVIVEG